MILRYFLKNQFGTHDFKYIVSTQRQYATSKLDKTGYYGFFLRSYQCKKCDLIINIGIDIFYDKKNEYSFSKWLHYVVINGKKYKLSRFPDILIQKTCNNVIMERACE